MWKKLTEKPGLLLTLGILIGAGLVWISSGVSNKTWNIWVPAENV